MLVLEIMDIKLCMNCLQRNNQSHVSESNRIDKKRNLLHITLDSCKIVQFDAWLARLRGAVIISLEAYVVKLDLNHFNGWSYTVPLQSRRLQLAMAISLCRLLKCWLSIFRS